MNKERKDKTIAVTGTIVVHALVLLVLCLMAFRTPLPLPGEEGAPVFNEPKPLPPLKRVMRKEPMLSEPEPENVSGDENDTDDDELDMLINQAAEKKAKRECMHMIFNEDGTLKYIIEDCDKEGYKRCPVCKKYIPLKFEEKNVQTLLDAIDVLNQIAFFGAMENLKADRIKTLIALKAIMPDVVQLAHELNTYVTLDQNTTEGMDSIATEYTDRMTGLTSWG